MLTIRRYWRIPDTCCSGRSTCHTANRKSRHSAYRIFHTAFRTYNLSSQIRFNVKIYSPQNGRSKLRKTLKARENNEHFQSWIKHIDDYWLIYTQLRNFKFRAPLQESHSGPLPLPRWAVMVNTVSVSPYDAEEWSGQVIDGMLSSGGLTIRLTRLQPRARKC